MRVTNAYIYSQNVRNFQRHQNDIQKANNRISGNGLVIAQSYDDAGVYSEGTRLVYELATFKQVQDAGSKALSITKNSDQTIKEMTSYLDQFKNKLIQAASNVHSVTSLNALANDLEAINSHLTNLANTSINGQYLFSGTSINVKPFDEHGEYHGNDESMKVVLGSKITTSYNITGKDLMNGNDNDYRKVITTNISLIDRRFNINEPDEVHTITRDNKIQDLIGRNYLKGEGLNEKDHFLVGDEARFPDTYFYVNGTKGSGESFRAKFKMGPKESVESLLNKIGELYGNKPGSELVKVELNKSGNIELTDIYNPNSSLSFHMVAATARAESIEQLYPERYGKNFADMDANARAGEVADETADETVDETAADETAGADETAPGEPLKMTKLLPPKVNSQLASVKDLKQLRDNDDLFVLHFSNNGSMSIDRTNDGLDFSRSMFAKRDNLLSSNMAQFDKNGDYVTNETKLVDAAHKRLKLEPDENAASDEVLKIEVTSISKQRYKVDFNITQGTATINYKSEGEDIARVVPITNVIYDQFEHKSDSFKTDNTDISFRQLNDIIQLCASDNIPSNDYELVRKYPDRESSPMVLKEVDHLEFTKLLSQSASILSVDINDNGKLQLRQHGATSTVIDLAIYDANNMSENEFDFGTHQQVVDGETVEVDNDEGYKAGNSFDFNTNSSLVIDESRVDILKDLANMVDTLRNNQYRADGSDASNQISTGIQGAIRRLDHIIDHISKVHTKVGATQKSIENACDRAQMMSINIEQVKSDVIDADYGESAMMLMQFTQAMQASLAASAQIQKLSLLDYMR